MTPHRGDVWLVDFGQPVGREQAGQRPGVILSSDLMNEGPAEIVVAVPCTTRFRGLPTQIELDPDDSGLDEVSYAKCEDVKRPRGLILVAGVHRHQWSRWSISFGTMMNKTARQNWPSRCPARRSVDRLSCPKLESQEFVRSTGQRSPMV